MAYYKLPFEVSENTRLLALKRATGSFRCSGDGEQHAPDCTGKIRARQDYVEWEEGRGRGRSCFPCAKALFGVDADE